jgi:AbiV family abortive infection protein
MAKRATGPLHVDQLADVARKALDNAFDLVNEADGLLSFGRYPRAYSLAILAAEEFGKFLIAQGAVAHLPGDDAYWRGFWERFRSHDAKGLIASALAAYGLEDEARRRQFLDQIERHVRADQNRKFAGLYVDVALDGSVVAPYEATDPRGAHDLLYVLGIIIRFFAEQSDGIDFHASYRAAQAGASQMAQAFRTGDPSTIAEAWHRTIDQEPPT